MTPDIISRAYTVPARPANGARRLFALFVLVACAGVASAQTTTQAQAGGEGDDALARSIVEKADEVRFPAKGFEVAVTIDNTSAEGTSESKTYRVLSKGNQNTIVMALEPASDRGQIMLMKGRDLWIFLPSVSQPVRLSLAQRLTGQVANGDLARANFAGDYVPRVVRVEDLDGEPTYVLELDAVDRSVTYHRVTYWVRQADFRPQMAQFYSISDRLLKTCYYRDYRMIAGRMRPGRLVMQDALRKGDESVLDYRDMRVRELPDKMFTKDYLKHLD